MKSVFAGIFCCFSLLGFRGATGQEGPAPERIGPPSRKEVLGLEKPKLGEYTIARLLRRGFLVTEKRARGMADLYEVFDPQDGELATLVTTDSLLEPVMEAAFLVFRASWAEEGKGLPSLLRRWIAGLSRKGPGSWPKAWRLAGGVLCVSLGILEGKGTLQDLPLPGEILQAARQELDRISRKRTAWSPLLGRTIVYGAFPLSSPLPGEGLFGGWVSPARLKAWLGQCAFMLDDPVQTRAAFLLAATAPKGWKQAFSLDRSLVGPLENLGIGAYQEALQEAGGLEAVQAGTKGWEKALAFLKGRVVPGKALLVEGPKGKRWIRFRQGGRTWNFLLPPLSCAWAESFLGVRLGKGLLLDGPGLSPDAEALQWGVYGKPAHPSGLVLAGGVGNSWALGKARSYCLHFLTGIPWAPRMARGAYDWNLVRGILAPQAEEPASLQDLFWDLFRAITRDKPPGKANREWYFSSPAWAERRARTGLAGWVLWRRAAGASVRRCLGLVGAAGFRHQGYVVPTCAELERFRRFVAFLRKVAPGVEPLREPLAKANRLVERVYQLRRKQEQGRPWNQEDQDFFAHYGKALKLRKDEGFGNRVQEKTPHAYACNVGDLMAYRGGILEAEAPEASLFAALALPRRIYALVRIGGKWYLARGGVLDYREFALPVEMTLDDQGWRDVLKTRPASGRLPGGEKGPGKREGRRLSLWSAISAKDPVALEAALLLSRRPAGAKDGLLRRLVGKARKACRDPWIRALTDEKIRPPGRDGLLFALKVLWKEDVDLALVPLARRMDFARRAARKAAEVKKGCPWKFFQALLRSDREVWAEAFQAWFEAGPRQDASSAVRVLLEYLRAPGPGIPQILPEPARVRLAGKVVEKCGKAFEGIFSGWKYREKTNLCKALFLAWSPRGFRLLDQVIQKAPVEFLKVTTSCMARNRETPLPEGTLRYFLAKIREGSVGGDLYFRFLGFLLKGGKVPGVKSIRRGWKILTARLLREGGGKKGKGGFLEKGFLPEDCLSLLLLARPGPVLGWVQEEIEKGNEDRISPCLVKAVKSIIDYWEGDFPGASSLPPLPKVFQGRNVTDWAALEQWLREGRKRLELARTGGG